MTAVIKNGAESLTMSLISESLTNLNRSFTPIMGYLKSLTDYQRELFKLELRDSVTGEMSPADAAQLPQIKKKFAQVNPGKPFYPDLAEEVIKEDTTKEGPALKERVLKSLMVAEVKPKTAKPQVSFKTILLEGVLMIGSTAQAFQDVAGKMDENSTLIENKKQGFWQKLKKAMAQMLNKEPDPIIYDVEYVDPARGVPVKEKINFVSFRNDLDRKIRTLSTISVKGQGLTKLESMQEEQIISFLEKNIREVQSLHKILGALDEFFKAQTNREDREKVKGIKPELATIKNAIIRANSKRHEYSAQKEEEEQLKRLGVNPVASNT
jgi:hypothetical protein